MKEGFIIINSESRLNPYHITTNPTGSFALKASYNLKHVNLDINKKYEIALVSAYLIADPVGVGDREDCNSLLDQLYIIESNLVKSNDYSSMTRTYNKNYNTRHIASVLNTAVSANVTPLAVNQCIKSISCDNIFYQEMDVSNLCNVEIVLKDTDDELVREPANEAQAVTAELTQYIFVFRYKEVGKDK